MCSLSRSRDFDGTRTALYFISVGGGTLPNVAGCLSANRSLPAPIFQVTAAAQSNLAFLGMWIESTRPDLAELLPFDADAGSSSNMASSPPGRPNRVQSWAER